MVEEKYLRLQVSLHWERGVADVYQHFVSTNNKGLNLCHFIYGSHLTKHYQPIIIVLPIPHCHDTTVSLVTTRLILSLSSSSHKQSCLTHWAWVSLISIQTHALTPTWVFLTHWHCSGRQLYFTSFQKCSWIRNSFLHWHWTPTNVQSVYNQFSCFLC